MSLYDRSNVKNQTRIGSSLLSEADQNARAAKVVVWILAAGAIANLAFRIIAQVSFELHGSYPLIPYPFGLSLLAPILRIDFGLSPEYFSEMMILPQSQIWGYLTFLFIFIFLFYRKLCLIYLYICTATSFIMIAGSQSSTALLPVYSLSFDTLFQGFIRWVPYYIIKVEEYGWREVMLLYGALSAIFYGTMAFFLRRSMKAAEAL